MKKVYTFSFLVLSFYFTHAQEAAPAENAQSTTPANDAGGIERPNFFFVNVNTTLSGNYYRGQFQAGQDRPKPWIGFDAGFTYERLMSKRISFGIGVNHSIKSMKQGLARLDSLGAVYQLSNIVARRYYVEIPVFANFYFLDKPMKPYFTIGLVNQLMYHMDYSSVNPKYKEAVSFSQLTNEGNRVYNLGLLVALGFKQELPHHVVAGAEVNSKVSLINNAINNNIYSLGLNILLGYKF